MGAGGAERDPGGAEEPTDESAGLRRRKALSTSGWLGDRTRENGVRHIFSEENEPGPTAIRPYDGFGMGFS
jgi:hypothetical protein